MTQPCPLEHSDRSKHEGPKKSRVHAAAREARYLATAVGKVLLFFYLPLDASLVFLHFPHDADATASPTGRRSVGFYESAYQGNSKRKNGADYEVTARDAADKFGILDGLREFAFHYRLADKKVLEVGSGRGYLQDLAADYTGLDLSPAVARHYHKPFVVGSATNMPFLSSTYDAVWSVWVLEHIPEPERALMEIRRVLKPDGLLFLHVAWNCPPWTADGFDVRPYSDFNWRGKLVKLSIPLRTRVGFQASYLLPTRVIRWAQYGIGGMRERLHFRALDPNYDVYWEPDSDAAISLDRFETFLWFRARGDECLNCGTLHQEWQRRAEPLVIRIRKTAASQ